MSQLVVLGFDTEEQALGALKSLRGLEHDGRISFEDTAVVTHHADGSFDVKNEASSATETGAAVGAILGGFVTFLFPPAGIAIGALAGAGVGALMGRGVSGDFVKDVKEELRPASRRCSRSSRVRTVPPRSPCCATSTARSSRRRSTRTPNRRSATP